MKNNHEYTKILEIYTSIKEEIIKRLNDFKRLYDSSDDFEIFCELVFCILTPQSSAVVCGDAVNRLIQNGLIKNGDKQSLSNAIHPVRFKNNKAGYIIEARNKFTGDNSVKIKSLIDSFKSNFLAREWLVKNIKGIAYKEASHFLRNIGKGENLAILDRHILKNLMLLKVIKEIPKTINQKTYMEIEKKFLDFSGSCGIDILHLDFIFWYKEAGKIFK